MIMYLYHYIIGGIHMLRRTLSLLLALVMVFGMVPTAALATEETTPETVAETIAVVVETTEAEVETTAPVVETTEAEEETTAPAVETTEAEEETLAPVETTEAEEETTAATEETEITLEAQAEAAMAAARAATSGECGAGLTWAIADSVLTISGSGEMKDYSIDSMDLTASPWRLAEAPFTSIVLDEGVASIGDGAFMGLEAVTSVTIPASVQSVGAYAFSGCIGLTEVVFPNDANGLKGIGMYAFADCGTLTVSLPASVTFVDETAFVSSLGTVVIDYAGTQEQWQDVCLGSLGSKVIINCSDVTIDPSKQPITGKCGEDLTWSLDRETGVLTITGTGAMTDYNDSDNLSPWHNAGVTVTAVVVEEGVESIGDYAFVGMSNLKEVTLPGSVESVGDSAFAFCSGLTKVTVSEGTKTIGENAFADCEVLAKVYVPASVESIADSAFDGCPYLTVDYAGTQEEWDAIYGGTSVKVNPSTQAPVTSGSCGEDVSWSVSGGVLTITGTGAMADYNGTDALSPWRNTGDEVITSIVVEEGVTSIGDYAFAGLEGLEEVTLPESLTEVGSNAFMDCEALTTVTFTGDAPAIADDAFTGVTADVNYPQTNETWTGEVRKDYGGDLTWNTPDVVDQGTTENGMSWTLDETGELLIDGNADSIPDNAFAGLEGVTTVVLPESVTSIGDGAFAGCTDLEKINLDNVTELGKDCFKGTKARIIVDISENPVYVNTQKTQLTYTAPAAVKAENIRWEITNSSAESNADIEAATGILHVTNKLDVTVRCYDSVSGAWDELKIHSEYVPVIVEPVLEEGSFAKAVMLTENAEPAANEKQLSKYALYLDKEDVASAAYTFDIRVSCADPELNLSNIKFSSTNTKVATVKGNTVTIKKKADGAAVILASVMEGKKVVAEGMLSIYVREYTPRLEAAAFTLNTKLEDASVTTALVSSYGCEIIPASIKLLESDGTESTRLIPTWKDGVLTITAPQTIAKNGAIKLTLTGAYANNELARANVPFEFPIKVTVKNTVPAITTKQTGKFNLFYTDSTAAMTITAKNAEVLGAELMDCDFVLTEQAGSYIISYAPAYDGAAKADAKGTLKVNVAGYSEPVEKAVTISTATTKPKLALTATSSVINTAVNQAPVTGFSVYDPATGEFLVKNILSVTCTKDFATASTHGLDTEDMMDDVVRLTLNGTTGGTATIEVKAPNWTQSIKLTHKVTVNTKLPTAKLTSTTLNLNSIFTQQIAGAYVTLDQANLVLKEFSEFATTAKAGSAAAEEAAKIAVSYADGTIIARIKDSANAPKNGTYTFKATPYLTDGTALKDVTIKVKVAATAPTVKLASTTLKLNKELPTEIGTVAAKITKGEGYTLTGFAVEGAAGLEITSGSEGVTIKLTSGAAVGKQALSLYPVFVDNLSGQQVTLDKAVKLTVQVYSGKPSVSISNKGKIDTIVPDSAITYTVSKISNALGKIDSVSLYGQDADKFQVVLGEENGKQVFQLTMKPGVIYNTKTTYKVGFKLNICGYEFEGPVKTFKVTQSKLKFTSAKTIAFFQSQTSQLKTTVTLTAPAGTTLSPEGIKLNTAKTAAAFIRSLGNGNTLVNPGEFKVEKVYTNKAGQVCVDLSFDINNHGHLTPGKSFAVVLDITPDGNAENVAPTQLKLTVKAYK